MAETIDSFNIYDESTINRYWIQLLSKSRNKEIFDNFLNEKIKNFLVKGRILEKSSKEAIIWITSNIKGVVKDLSGLSKIKNLKGKEYYFQIKDITRNGLEYVLLVIPFAETTLKNENSETYQSKHTQTIQVVKPKQSSKQSPKISKSDTIDSFIKKIHVGDIYNGIINNITDKYAFIEIEGTKNVSGILLPSEADWCMPVSKFNKLQIKDKVKCKIIEVDISKKRFSGSLKVDNNPFILHATELKIGDVYNGIIVEERKDFVTIYFYEDLYVDVPKAVVMKEDGSIGERYDVLPFLITKYDYNECKIYCSHTDTWLNENTNKELKFDDFLLSQVFEKKEIALLHSHELSFANKILHKFPDFTDVRTGNLQLNINLNVRVGTKLHNEFNEYRHHFINKDLWLAAFNIATHKYLYIWTTDNYLIEAKLKGPILELLTVVGPNDTYCADLLAICSKSKLCISAGNVKFIMDTTMPIPNSVKTYERILWYCEYTRIKESLSSRLNTNNGELKNSLINVEKYIKSQIQREIDKNGETITIEESEIIEKRTLGEFPNQLAMKIHIDNFELKRLLGEHSLENIEDDFYVEVSNTDERGVSAHLTEDATSNNWRISFNRGVTDLSSFQKGFRMKYKPSIRHYEIQEESVRHFYTKDTLGIFGDLVTKTIQSPNIQKYDDIKYLNDIFYNSEDDNNQCKAVKASLGNQQVMLIQGPPGTGKTTVIVEIVRQLINEGKHVLVCSQANAAVDNIYQKLKEVNEENEIRLLRIGREGDAEAWGDAYDPEVYKSYLKYSSLLFKKLSEGKDKLEIKDFISDLSYNGKVDFKKKHCYVAEYFHNFSELPSIDIIEGVHGLIDSQEYINARKSNEQMFYSMDVVLGTCIGVGMNPTLREMAATGQRFFDTVIIDEAAKANLAETIVPMRLGRRFVLVGDDNQLPPYIDRQELQDFCTKQNIRYSEQKAIFDSMSTSFFEQCHQLVGDENVISLNYQHRMHPEIGNCISNLFYNGNVKNGSQTKEREMSLSSFPNAVTFVDTTSYGSSAYEKKTITMSYYNQKEIDIIKNEILPNINSSIDFSLAIISPYMGQVQQLKKQLPEQYKNSIYTIDSIQGSEFDVVVFSFVRAFSNDAALQGANVGFVDDMRRLNVSLSRAKKKLILVGNLQTLQNPEAHKHVMITEHSDRHPLEVFNKISSYVLSTKLLSIQEQYILYLKKHPHFEIDNFKYEPISKVPGLFKFTFEWEGHIISDTSLGLSIIEKDPNAKLRFEMFTEKGDTRYKVISCLNRRR